MLEDLADLTQVNFAAQEQKSAFSNAAKLAQKPMINPVLLGIVASPEIDSFRRSNNSQENWIDHGLLS